MKDDVRWKVGEVARIARVTIRTLHHYDEIGLLRPSHRAKGEYRLYGRADLERLQQIRLYRDLGLPLEEIRAVLDDPDFDRVDALRRHRARLEEKRDETDRLIKTLDRMMQGDETMTAEDLFDGFDQEAMEREAGERWGDSPAWKTSQQRKQRYSKELTGAIQAEHEQLLRDFADCMAAGHGPDSAEARALAERARLHIDRWWYPLSKEAHVQLAQLYVCDPRFEKTYETVAEGLARYVVDAVTANAAA